jgi:hypothetical protein
MTISPSPTPHNDRASSARGCDLVRQALSLAETFRQEADGHHAKLRQFLQDAFALLRRFGADPEAWGELRHDPFWLEQRRKPKLGCNGRDLLLFLTQATSANERSRAAKYAIALEFLLGADIPEDQVAVFIAEAGGMDAVHQNALALARSALPLNGAATGEGSEGNCGAEKGGARKKPTSVRQAGAVVAATARRELAQSGEANPDAYVSATADIVGTPPAYGLNLSPTRRGPGKVGRFNSIVIQVEDADFERLVLSAAPETPARRVLIEVIMSTSDPPRALAPVKILKISPVANARVGREATVSVPDPAGADKKDTTHTPPARATASERFRGPLRSGREVQVFCREDRVREAGRRSMAQAAP